MANKPAVQKLPIDKITQFAEIELQYKTLKEKREQLRIELLKAMQGFDLYTMKTGKYTLYRGKRLTPHVVDFNVLKAGLEAENIPYETEEVFHPRMNLVFRMLAKDKRELEGLEVAETEYVAIKTKGKEDK